MNALETLFPTTASLRGKSNTELAYEVGEAWIAGRVTASPIHADTPMALDDLVLSRESLWVVVDVYANDDREDDWDEREGVYRQQEAHLMLLGGTETEHLSWLLKFPTIYRVNVLES